MRRWDGLFDAKAPWDCKNWWDSHTGGADHSRNLSRSSFSRYEPRESFCGSIKALSPALCTAFAREDQRAALTSHFSAFRGSFTAMRLSDYKRPGCNFFEDVEGRGQHENVTAHKKRIKLWFSRHKKRAKIMSFFYQVHLIFLAWSQTSWSRGSYWTITVFSMYEPWGDLSHWQNLVRELYSIAACSLCRITCGVGAPKLSEFPPVDIPH